MSHDHIDLSPYKFSDLVDLTAFAQMLENFFKATRIPNGLVANDGEILSQSGWENACTRFHRVHPQTAERCVESNLEIMNNLKAGETCGKLCSNGLLDYATPIEIEGKQIATLFLGQILHTSPDIEFFRQQAKQFGFDEAEYLNAINEIPVIEKTEIDALMTCMVDMAQMLALSGLARLRQTKMERDITKHRERRIQLEDILDSSPVAIGWSDANGKIEYVNRAFQHLFGYTLADIPDLNSWYQQAYPDQDYRENIVFPWYKEVDLSRITGIKPPELEVTITCKDGSTRRVLLNISWVGNRRLVNFSDLTEHWLTEQRMHAHDAMLEMVATGSPLPDILNAIVKQVQAEDHKSLCSVLLLDEEGQHLLTGATPDLPDFYNQAIDGIEIGIGVGSCGTAAFLGKRVIVEDIKTHEYWQPYLQLAEQAGIEACWSEPIISTTGKVLGTFAIYHRSPTTPNQHDIERISFAANLASIAIENHQTHQELEHRAYYDHLTGLPNRRYFLDRAEKELAHSSRYDHELSVLMMDVDHFKQINDAYGHKFGDIVLQKLAESCLATLRDADSIGRFGGEEFAILLPETGYEQALEAAERLRLAVASTQVPIPNHAPLHFTVSLGVTTLVEPNSNIDLLLNQADQALYQAKKTGRNRVCLFKPDTVDVNRS